MNEQPRNAASSARIPWPSLPWIGRSFLVDVPIFALGIALLYTVVALARYWSGPLTPQVEIDLRARALPLYALYSVLRIYHKQRIYASSAVARIRVRSLPCSSRVTSLPDRLGRLSMRCRPQRRLRS